jgi:hypothetical protein
MLLQPTSDFMDRYVAPVFSDSTAANIPDMSAVSPGQRHWLANFILNSWARATMDDDSRRTLFNFLRRTQAAFREYEEARRLTLAHLADRRRNAISLYITAVGHWEQFIPRADRAWAVLVKGEKILFVKGDGSVVQRLNLLYNRTKHIESAIKSGQLPPDGTLPVWLTNDGLRSVDAQLASTELAETLTDLAKWADAAQDPLTMPETIRVTYALGEEEMTHQTS